MIRTIEKALILIIFLYLDWFQYIFGTWQVILYAAALLLAVLMLLETVHRRTIQVSGIPKNILGYLLFGVYAFATGVIVAPDKGALVDAILRYLEYIFVCYAIYHISKSEQSMTWFLGILYISAMVCAFQTIFFGQIVKSGVVYVTTMARGNNPNVLGVMMVLGMMAVLFDYRIIQKRFALIMASLAIFAYTCILTGSRQGFISMALLLVCWLWIYWVYTRKSGNPFQIKGWRGFLQNMAIVAGVVAVLFYITNHTFRSSSIFTKLLLFTQDTTGNSSERVDLYRQAIELFRQHPFFGIGFQQFQVIHERHLYSHSTYAEVLSCNGIVGMLIFFSPLAWLTVKLGIRSFEKTNEFSYMYRMLLLFMVIELFIAAIRVVPYELGCMGMFTFLFWQYDQLEESRDRLMLRRRNRRRLLSPAAGIPSQG